MSSTANCYDNAPAESWFGLFKREKLYQLSNDKQGEIQKEIYKYFLQQKKNLFGTKLLDARRV